MALRTEKEIKNKLNKIMKGKWRIHENTYRYGQVKMLRWVLMEKENLAKKITKEMEKEMKRLREEGMPVKDIAKKFNVHRMSVSNHTIKGSLKKASIRSYKSFKGRRERLNS